MFYTTERVLEYKSGKKKEFQPATLYRPENETENCGVGLVASLKSVPSRKVVEQADEMLVRMSHRGGCGCDPASGDGAGMLIVMLILMLLE
jgi:glutamate synthase domain-containing protein 1